MPYKNSLADRAISWAYATYFKPPDEPIPMFERFQSSDGQTLYRSLDSSRKEITEIEAVRQIADDERKPFTEIWGQKDRFIRDEVPPQLPEQQQQKQEQPQQHRAYTDNEGGIGHSGRLRPGSGSLIRSWDVEPQQKHTLKMELDR